VQAGGVQGSITGRYRQQEYKGLSQTGTGSRRVMGLSQAGTGSMSKGSITG
ncbi:hypothetical protein NDU88_000383, partial [Pleurodeles waltl]